MNEWPPVPPDPADPNDFAPPSPSASTPPPPPAWGPPGGAPPPQGPSALAPIPWEDPSIGFFAGFYESLRLLIASPRKAFERVGTKSLIARPLGFAILIGWPGIVASTLWDIALKSQMEEWMPWAAEQRWERSPTMEIAFALAAPCWLPVVLLIAAAILHLFLWMVGGAKRRLVDTFRVLCYAQVSSLFALLPLCGSLIAGIWYLVLEVIGFSAVHRISTGRAVFAVVLPLLLCCGCVAILISLFGAAILAGMRGGH